MLQSLLDAAHGSLGPLGPIILVAGPILFIGLLFLMMNMQKSSRPFDRVESERTGKNKQEADAKAELRRGASDKMEKLDRFAHFLEPQSAEEMGAARKKMLKAGYRSKNAVRIFHFSQMALGIGLLVLGVIYTMLLSRQQELSTQATILYTLLPGAFGYFMPSYWVTRRIETRKQEITQGFPDALDMLLVCIEAGQSLDQSILRVAKEGAASFPTLAEEFELVSQEVKAGKERAKVLRDMAERVDLQDLTSFVTTLIQSATFGTSIAESLRVYSAEMRDKRVMRAEEKANTLPTKLTLGTMIFTLPPLLIILIGPSVAGMAENFSKMSGGG